MPETLAYATPEPTDPRRIVAAAGLGVCWVLCGCTGWMTAGLGQVPTAGRPAVPHVDGADLTDVEADRLIAELTAVREVDPADLALLRRGLPHLRFAAGDYSGHAIDFWPEDEAESAVVTRSRSEPHGGWHVTTYRADGSRELYREHLPSPTRRWLDYAARTVGVLGSHLMSYLLVVAGIWTLVSPRRGFVLLTRWAWVQLALVPVALGALLLDAADFTVARETIETFAIDGTAQLEERRSARPVNLGLAATIALVLTILLASYPLLVLAAARHVRRRGGLA